MTVQHFVILPSSQPLVAYADSNQSSASDQQSSNPTQLDIPDHQISLPIQPSAVVNGEWQVTTQGVSLLTPQQLGQAGSGYVLFGHDWPVLLGRMRQAVIGQSVVLTYKDGHTDTYKITSVFNVSPNQVDVLSMAKPDTLLIYTCNGILDTKRFVVLAQRVK